MVSWFKKALYELCSLELKFGHQKSYAEAKCSIFESILYIKKIKTFVTAQDKLQSQKNLFVCLTFLTVSNCYK